MAENIPNSPAGALPPKPSEAAKVQPKKETVRINLPPKPTAGPSIKIPSPAGAPPPAAAAPPPAAAPVASAGAVPAPVAAARPVASAPPAPALGKSPPSPARPAPAMAVASVGGMDMALGGLAALLALAALVRVFMLSN